MPSGSFPTRRFSDNGLNLWMIFFLRRFFSPVGILSLFLNPVIWAETTGEFPFIKGSETLVVFPYTEGYAGRRPEVMNAMTRWTGEEIEKRNIRACLVAGPDELPLK